MKYEVSVVIPAFNEEKSITKVVKNIGEQLAKYPNLKYETIVIDDGSTDKTGSLLTKLKRAKLISKIVTHPKNRGYGSSLKSGISESKYDWILIIDADSTYPIKDIYKLIKEKQYFNMVVGARVKKDVAIPYIRRIPKVIMLWTAIILTQKSIRDLNSGLRIFDKKLAEEFWHLFPDGFSFTSTITLGSHLSGYSVKYVPISYYKRVGQSSISFMHFFYFMLLVIKMVVYFKPLQFFFIPGITFLSIGFLWTIYTLITKGNVTDSGVLIFVTGLQITLFGLIADLVVKTREHLHNTRSL